MSLDELLRTQRDELSALIDLLRHEQALLVQGGRNLETLESLAHHKQARQRALEGLEQRRLSLGDATEFEQAVASGGVLGLWQDVQDKARRAAYLNRLNGNLMQQCMNHNQRILDTLRDLASARLYGADGQALRGSGRLQSLA